MNTTKFCGSSKALRLDIASIFAGIGCSSFIYHLYLWNHFLQSQPREPNPALGFLYSMNNHGWYYYLSAIQKNEMTMLFCMAFAFFLLTAAVYPRDPAKKPWEGYATVAGIPWKYFWRSSTLSFGILWIAMPHLASLLVSKGIILNF
jgi:hypothetical protein